MAEVTKITPDEIPLVCETQPLKVTRMGNVTEVQMCSFRNRKKYIQILPDRKYIYLTTGEVKEFKDKAVDRTDNTSSLRRSFKKLREIINANAAEPEKCRWVTLTYAENMTDTKRLYEDFDLFRKRFEYWNKKEGREKPEYISVVEPQGRGAWHCHVLFIFKEKAPFIENKTMAELWKQGFVNVQALENVDNLGAYLTAYLADIPIEEATAGQVGEVKEVNGKKYLKGGRLCMYPPGMNLYRSSRGIKKAHVEYMSRDRLDMSELGGMTYRRTVKITYEEGQPTFIDTMYYNKKRKDCQGD